MNPLIVLSCLVAACSGQILTAAPYAAGLAPYAAYNGLPLAGLPLAGLPYAYAAGAPLAAPLAAAPAIPAPLAAPSSQFQAQDEFGNVNYGYSNINSAKQEVGNAYGGVTGSYSYVDANGALQRVDYIADDLGFRVKATNLPVAPNALQVPALEGPIDTGVAPEPVMDTPEVAAAKAEFQAAFDEAASREKRSADADPAILYNNLAYNTYGLPYAANAYGYGYGLAGWPYAATTYGAYNLGYAGLPINAYNGLAYNGLALNAYAAPVAAVAAAPAAAAVVASAPAAREAILTKIQLNPGHAVAYRVD